ncbi:MAG: hypothetical protein ACC645_05950 [Pirellulales bacterium]
MNHSSDGQPKGSGSHSGSWNEFRTTHWSLVERAVLENDQGPRDALAELLRRYLPALRVHLLNTRAIAESQVDDLLQNFVSDKILQSDLLARADDRLGKFRTLLLTALHRYLVDQWRAQNARKRRAEQAASLDSEVPEYLARTDATAARSFDVAWARQVLARTLAQMEHECQTSGRVDIWDIFRHRLVDPILHGGATMPYEQLVAICGLSSPRQAANVLITGKRMFARILREVVAEYTPRDEVNAEIDQLQLDLSRDNKQ